MRLARSLTFACVVTLAACGTNAQTSDAGVVVHDCAEALALAASCSECAIASDFSAVCCRGGQTVGCSSGRCITIRSDTGMCSADASVDDASDG